MIKLNGIYREADALLNCFGALRKSDLVHYLAGIIAKKSRKRLSFSQLYNESERVINRLKRLGLLDVDGNLVTGGYKNTLKRRINPPERGERYALYYLSFLRRSHNFDRIKLLKPALKSAHALLEYKIDRKLFALSFLSTKSDTLLEEALQILTAEEILLLKSRTMPLSEIVEETCGIDPIYLLADKKEYTDLITEVKNRKLEFLIAGNSQIAIFSGFDKRGYKFLIKTLRGVDDGDE